MPLALIGFLLSASFDPSVLTVDITYADVDTNITQHATTTADLVALATSTAKKYGLNTERFLKVIWGESQWNVCAKGDYVNGEPTSWGLAQLHYPLRDWGVTREQACDPYIALPIMAKAWTEGKQRKWSKWVEFYGD